MTDQNQPQQPETVEVENLDQFVKMLMAWHQSKVTQLNHMLQIPEGVEVVVNETESHILAGDLRKGFIIGLELGLMELGTLPFAAEMEEVKPASPDESVH